MISTGIHRFVFNKLARSMVFIGKEHLFCTMLQFENQR